MRLAPSACARLILVLLLYTAVLVTTPPGANATNYPCSGKKDGINHCQGSTFICNDGSVSASKKNCSAEMGSVGLVSPPEMQPTAGKDCTCDAGKYCIGPRGGHYCVEDDGEKSYLRK